MEIDTVAECNRGSLYARKKLKTPMFQDLPVLKESNAETKHSKNLHMKTDSITKSLLTISEQAGLDYYRSKFPKRTSGDQFGPWLPTDKWSPRKRQGQSRRGKHFSKTAVSPSRFPSPIENRRPQRRFDTKIKHRKFPQTDEEHRRADDIEIEDGVGEGERSRSRVRPATVPGLIDLDLPTNYTRIDLSPDLTRSRTDINTPAIYPVHSLPTLITLKPADSTNIYDNVFSLEKSDLSTKDLIISMGQHPRHSSNSTRQTNSVIISNHHTPQQDLQPTQDECQHYNIKYPDDNTAPSMNESSKVLATDTRKSAPPRCEHGDISQHIRHYRIFHTVRFTGRFSLANDPPQMTEVQQVQWNDVFPHRPLSSTFKSATSVPVFRFSVSDFQKENMTVRTERFPEENSSQSRSTATKADLQRRSTGKPDTGLIKTSAAISTSLATRPAIPSKSKKEKPTIFLSPIVTQVSKSPRASLTSDDIEKIEKSKSVCQLRKSKSSSPSGFELGRKLHTNPRSSEGEKEYNVDYNEDEEVVYHNNDIRYSSDFDNKTKETAAKIYKQPEANSLATKERENTHVEDSKISKTQDDVQSSYTVYNDTIQNVPSVDSTHGYDYKENLQRRKRKGKGLPYVTHDIQSGIDKSNLPQSEDASLHSRFRSNKKFTSILKDIMSVPPCNTFVKHPEPKQVENSQTQSMNDEKQSECQSLVDSTTTTSCGSESKSSNKPKRPTLTIDAQQLHDSVVRKICQGNKFLSRSWTSSSLDYNDRFVRFLVKDDKEQKTSPCFQTRSANSPQLRSRRGLFLKGVSGISNATQATISSVDIREKNIEMASSQDLQTSCDISPTDNGDQLMGNRQYVDAQTHSSTSGRQTTESPRGNTSRVWRPSASRWNRKSSSSRSTSSMFHYQPTPSSASAYVIAVPPFRKGFDDKSVVLPLEDFVQMAMKSRENSFSAWSQTVNAGSKVGIAPNSRGRASSVRKSPDDRLVRVVSFATPVNQFIFAKRITGLPLASNSSNMAEEAGRDVFQRKMAGTFRLRLNDADQFDTKAAENVEKTTNDTKVQLEEQPRDVKTKDDNTTSRPIKEYVYGDGHMADIPVSSHTPHRKESNINCRKIEVDMQNLLSQTETDDISPARSDLKLKTEMELENPATLAKRQLHSNLRSRVIHLAGLKNSKYNTTNNRSDVIQPDSFVEQNKVNISATSSEVENLQNYPTAQQKSDLLAFKFSHLKERRNALRGCSVLKQTSLIRKSHTLENGKDTLNAECLSPDLSDRSTLIAKGHSPRKDLSSFSGSPQRPKTVRFACDETDNIESPN